MDGLSPEGAYALEGICISIYSPKYILCFRMLHHPNRQRVYPCPLATSLASSVPPFWSGFFGTLIELQSQFILLRLHALVYAR